MVEALTEEQLLADIKTMLGSIKFEDNVKAAEVRLGLQLVWDTHRTAACLERIIKSME